MTLEITQDPEISISKENKKLLMDHLKLLKENLSLLQSQRNEVEHNIFSKRQILRDLEDLIKERKKFLDEIMVIDESILNKTKERDSLKEEVARLYQDIQEYKAVKSEMYTHKYLVIDRREK